MKVFELAKLYDATVSAVQLEGRFIGLKDLRPNSELAKYQADEIAKRLLQRARVRRPSPTPGSTLSRAAADFRGLPQTEQRVMAMLERPNRNGDTPDVSHIDLRLLREGLGMNLELAAGTIGAEAADLQRWETDPATPAWQTRELLSAYAVHMAAMWGFDQLRLDAHNFEDIIRVPAAESQREAALRQRPSRASVRPLSLPRAR